MSHRKKQFLEFTSVNRKIGEVSDMFDLSPEMIRFIEKNGLVSPIYSEDKGYRVYSPENMIELYHYIRLRNIGFSVKDIISISTSPSTLLLANKMVQQSQMLFEEIEAKKSLYHYLQGSSVELKSAVYNIGVYWFDTLTAGVFEPFVITVDNQPLYSKTAIMWRKCAPFGTLILIHNTSALPAPFLNWGIYMMENDFERLHLSSDEYSCKLQESVCLCTVVEASLSVKPDNLVQPLLEECQKQFGKRPEQVCLFHLGLIEKGKEKKQLLKIYAPIASENL